MTYNGCNPLWKSRLILEGVTPILILWLSRYYTAKSGVGVTPFEKLLKKMFGLLYKALVCPLEAIPTWNEDSTTDILIKHKGEPHSDKSEAEHNTEKIAETNAYEPLYDDSEVEWEEYITRCTKSVCSPYIDTFSDLKQYIHPETPTYKGGDFLIIREWTGNERSTQST